MEHIVNSHTDGIDFSRYLTYLDSVRDHLPSHIYSFASDSRHFDLSSGSSLHDAWLESCTIRETATLDDPDTRGLEIALVLLGQYHDRHIYLRYTGITHYSLVGPSQHATPRYDNIAHGDLLTHEIRLGQGNRLVHELSFSEGATILIECADIRHSEEMIKSDT